MKELLVSFFTPGQTSGLEIDTKPILAYTLSATLFELLSHPDEYDKVKAEIASALPDQSRIPSYSDVENLPYFSAVI